jgi:hypothetical protein
MSDEPTNTQITPRWAVTALSTAAAICLVISLYLAIKDKVAAGTLTAGLFAVCVLFIYLPQIQSFRAWGIEVALRNVGAKVQNLRRSVAEVESARDEERAKFATDTPTKLDQAIKRLSAANNALSESLGTVFDVTSGKRW